jgi:hypothetical protein
LLWLITKKYYNRFYYNKNVQKVNIGAGRFIRRGWKNLDYYNSWG